MKKRVFLGIDTSNYTTSLAICDESGVILENYKVLLPVKEGENGLRPMPFTPEKPCMRGWRN